MRWKAGILLALAMALAGTACTKGGGSSAPSSGTPPSETTPAPTAASPTAAVPAGASPTPLAIEQSNFVDTIDNPWFPLPAGTTLTYKGIKDGEPSKDVFEITGETKVIGGVRCSVIKDTLTVKGNLHEKTDDWYAQDVEGNVWYFGEDTAEYNDKGKVVSREGTWATGVDGAEPGIFMPADPQIGQSFQQEYLAGHAEDHFVVLHMLGKAKTPYRTFQHTLVTGEWTPLEPNVLTQKYYVKGIGTVLEVDVAGSNERNELVSVTRK